MSVVTALYQTYNNALKKDMVDQTELLNQQSVLLPVYQIKNLQVHMILLK